MDTRSTLATLPVLLQLLLSYSINVTASAQNTQVENFGVVECRANGCGRVCSCLVHQPKTCMDILHNGCNTSGVYRIYPVNFERGVDVYCDQDTDGGGWLVFQRRINGSVDFDRPWLDYKYGFGTLDGEFWLGNELLYLLTTENPCRFRLDAVNVHNQPRNATFHTFFVKPESHSYQLHAFGYSGFEALRTGTWNLYFTTQDRYMDDKILALPQRYGGGWWYSSSHPNNMNGRLGHDANTGEDFYLKWTEHGEDLKQTELKFRPRYD